MSNAYATWLIQEDRHWKRCVILRNVIGRHLLIKKDFDWYKMGMRRIS